MSNRSHAYRVVLRDRPLRRQRMTVLLLLVLTLALSSCREHPRVTSRESLDLIKQVYTACNTRNAARLTKCEAAYAELVEKGLLSAEEQKSFERILQTAQSGDWAAAQASSLQFARDQVR
jgi:hypothetical protein